MTQALYFRKRVYWLGDTVGLLERLAYKELPPRVEYKLSEKGLAFLPILENIKEWNCKYEVALTPKATDRVSYPG